MKKGPVLALLLAAVASAFNVVSLRLEHLLDPRWYRDGELVAALIVIGVVTAAGLALAYWCRLANRWLVIAAIVVVVAGFVPRVLDGWHKRQEQATQSADNRDFEAKLLAGIETRSQDIEARIEAQKAYGPDEAEALIKLVQSANLTYRSLADHTAKAMPLLQRALEGKVIDPNVPVKNRFIAKAPPEPLFLQFYKTVRQRPEAPLLSRDWNIMLLLVANGANLTTPGAEPVVADLSRTATPLHDGLYVELK